jgi:hypothetical protein
MTTTIELSPSFIIQQNAEAQREILDVKQTDINAGVKFEAGLMLTRDATSKKLKPFTAGATGAVSILLETLTSPVAGDANILAFVNGVVISNKLILETGNIANVAALDKLDVDLFRNYNITIKDVDVKLMQVQS